MTFLEDIFSRHAILHKFVTINKFIWMEIQVITNRCFGLFMRRNVSTSRNRTKIERLLDWKEFPSKSVGRFSFQCLTDINTILQNVLYHFTQIVILLSALFKEHENEHTSTMYYNNVKII